MSTQKPSPPIASQPAAIGQTEAQSDTKSIGFSVAALAFLVAIPSGFSAGLIALGIAASVIAIVLADQARKHATTNASEQLSKWMSVFAFFSAFVCVLYIGTLFL